MANDWAWDYFKLQHGAEQARFGVATQRAQSTINIVVGLISAYTAIVAVLATKDLLRLGSWQSITLLALSGGALFLALVLGFLAVTPVDYELTDPGEALTMLEDCFNSKLSEAQLAIDLCEGLVVEVEKMRSIREKQARLVAWQLAVTGVGVVGSAGTVILLLSRP